MNTWNLPTQAFFTICFLLFSNLLLGQQYQTVQFSGAKMRAPLALPKGISTVQICGLEPNQSYQLIATPMAYGQDASFEVAPGASLSKGTSAFAYSRNAKNAVRFAAPSSCIEIEVKTQTAAENELTPLYLSIKCESCPEANAWLDKFSGIENQSVLEVQDSITAKSLIEDVLVGGGCFQISNVSYSGEPGQIGTFSNGQSNIGIDQGVILATGRIGVAPGPNDSDGSSWGYGYSTPDADLATLTTGSTFDMANIEFDFVPTENQVVFEFAFASEEYCEYVNTAYNDVFGFFISGPGINGVKNIALVPSTNTPVSINTVNHLANSNLYVHNSPQSIDHNLCGMQPATGPAIFEIQYDGFTKKMVAVANVIPCQTYHIKLKIADVADGVWDSAVFLRANSFNAGGQVLASPSYPNGLAAAYENCDNGSIVFTRGTGNPNLPLSISFNVGGSAIPGVDYLPLSSPVIIPAGQNQVVVPVTILNDALVEGQENIQLTIPNACACSQGVIDFLIQDLTPLSLTLDGQTLCQGDTALLSPTITGGASNATYSYLWSTGESSSSIQVLSSSSYTLQVSDGCGSSTVSSAVVFADCGCGEDTYFKTLGRPGQNTHGFGVYDSKEGNLYITGMQQDSALITKMAPTGTILWSRTFDIQTGISDRISELIVDAEGMLVGCGHSGAAQPGISGFVFRYDPNTNTMLWLNRFSQESPYVHGILERSNGNYLLYDDPYEPTNDIRILEIARANGQILGNSPLSQKLNLGIADNFNSAVMHNGKIYAVGRYTNGGALGDARQGMSRIDQNSGNVEWSKIGHVPSNLDAQLHGMDLLVESNHLYTVSYGNELGDDLSNSQIFLQKSDLGGNLVWIRRFNIPSAFSEVVDELISVPDGFILYAHDNASPGNLYLIKTDKEGIWQWSKKVDYGFQNLAGAYAQYQSQILMKDDHLYFVGTAQESPNSAQQGVIVKTKLDASLLNSNCNFIQPVATEFSTVLAAVNVTVFLQKVPYTEQIVVVNSQAQDHTLSLVSQCKNLVEEQYNIRLCPGESVSILGISYTQDTSLVLEFIGASGCDTIRTYLIDAQTNPSRSESISFCAGGSVNINGQVYTQSAIVVDTLPSSVGCDTVVTYTLIQQPNILRSEQISFCPGDAVVIGEQVYTQAGIVVDTLFSAANCDTIVTYTLSLLDQPTRNETIFFCPGETISLGGSNYTQPGVVSLNLPSNTGACDTLATYTLLFSTPAPSTVNIGCPASIVIAQPGTNGGSVVTYNAATASTDCTCPGLDLQQSSGLPSGSLFPLGVTNVCFMAKDSCGQTASCCFNVSIGEDEGCDIQVVGCIKYELLTITEDAGKNRTYRVRVTNNCSSKLLYTAIQVPDGMVAMEPDNFSTYMAPSGNTYRVRSPNHSPMHSIRFTSQSDSIQNGESDIFKYTLPAQANVTFINVVSRLDLYQYVSAHLNTFYCPIGVTPVGGGNRPGEDRNWNPDQEMDQDQATALFLFPNPTSADVHVDLSAWQEEQLQIQVLDSHGLRVKSFQTQGGHESQVLEMPESLPGGLYLVEILTESGLRYWGRFVRQN